MSTAADKDPHTGFDHTAHFAVVSGSRIGMILGTSIFGDEVAAAEGIFGLGKREYTEAMALGVKHEPLLVDTYVGMKRDREKVDVGVKVAEFRPDPVLPYLKATPDRDVVVTRMDRSTDRGVLEAKFKGGKTINEMVVIYRCPQYYINQVMLEMKVSDVKWCDLAVGSNINTVYVTVRYDSKWWGYIEPAITKFYDDYLRWYWENDRTEARLAALRALPSMTPEHFERIVAHQPPREGSLQMQQLRKASNQRAALAS